MSQKKQLVKAVKDHKSWRANVSLSEVAAMLQGNPSFTYVVSEGMDECHFFLSFVDSDQIVKHKNVRILIEKGKWALKNGQGSSYEALDHLVPNCLHCSANACKPLT